MQKYFFKKAVAKPTSIFRSINEELRIAASNGDLFHVQELLAKGAKFVPDKDGRTALHLACIGGHTQAAQLLIEGGSDLNTQDKLGYTALQRTCLEGHTEIVRLLLDANANVDKQDFVQENTPLHETAWHGHAAAMELLVHAKANLYIRNKTGSTALHLASQNGHAKCGRLILQAGCKADVKDKYDDTPLHTACRYMHASVVKMLLESGANPNEVNKNGDTPLHLTCNLSQRRISKLLMEFGAQAEVKNKQGESPLDIATRKHLCEIIEILKNKKCQNNNPAGGFKPSAVNQRQRKSKIRDRLKASKEGGSTWQLLFQDWSQPAKLEISHKQNHASTRQLNLPSTLPLSNHICSAAGNGLSPSALNSPAALASCLAKGEQLFVDLSGNVRKGPVGSQCACFCAPFFYQLVKQNNEVHKELLEEIDACHNELSNEIQDLRHVTERRLNSVSRAIDGHKSRGTTGCQATLQSKRPGEKIPEAMTSSGYKPPSNLPLSIYSPTSPASDFKTPGYGSRLLGPRLMRSMSESELETDIERERTHVELDSDDSLSNVSEDLYLDRTLCKMQQPHWQNSAKGVYNSGRRSKSQSRSTRRLMTLGSTHALPQMPLLTLKEPTHESLKCIAASNMAPTQHHKDCEVTPLPLCPGLLSPASNALERRKAFMESVKQFNEAQQNQDTESTLEDSNCGSTQLYQGSASSNHYTITSSTATTTEDSSNRNSLYSYNSQLSQLSSQMSTTNQSFQPSVDSGYGSNHANPILNSACASVESGSKADQNPSPGEIWSPSVETAINQKQTLASDWLPLNRGAGDVMFLNSAQLANLLADSKSKASIGHLGQSFAPANQIQRKVIPPIEFIPISPALPSTPTSTIDMNHFEIARLVDRLDKIQVQVNEVETQTDLPSSNHRAKPQRQLASSQQLPSSKPAWTQNDLHDYTELDFLQNKYSRHCVLQESSNPANQPNPPKHACLSTNRSGHVVSKQPIRAGMMRSFDDSQLPGSVRPAPSIPIPPPPRKPLPPLPGQQLPVQPLAVSADASTRSSRQAHIYKVKAATPQAQRKAGAGPSLHPNAISGGRPQKLMSGFYCMSTNV